MKIERPWASLEAKLNELKVDCEFPALLDDCEITRHREHLALPDQHPHYTHQQNLDHAVARVLAHQQNRRKPEPIVQHVEHHQHTHHGWRWWEWLLAVLLVLGLMAWSASKAHGQNVVVRGAAKGTTPAANTTATASDGNHTGLDVNCVSGCGAGSGAVAIADGTAPANKATVDSGNLHVNCAVGCSGGSTTPADTFATPTTAGIQMIFPALYNGTTWDRWRGDATNGAWVNIKTSVALAVTGTFWQATQPISAATLPLPTGAALDSSLGALDTDVKANIVLAAGTHVIGHVIADTGSTTAVAGNVAVTQADGSSVTLGAKTDAAATQTDTTSVSVVSVLKEISAKAQAPASTPVTGTFFQSTQPVSNAGTFAAQAQPTPVTSGGLITTNCAIQTAASTNATNCKNAAGQIYHIEVINTTSTLYYLRLYNLAAAPTCSSATGFVRSIPVPHNSGNGAGFEAEYGMGEAYGTGIGFCLTGGGSSTDNTNAATGLYVTVFYK